MAVFIAFLLLVLALPIGARGDTDENARIDRIEREMIQP